MNASTNADDLNLEKMNISTEFSLEKLSEVTTVDELVRLLNFEKVSMKSVQMSEKPGCGVFTELLNSVQKVRKLTKDANISTKKVSIEKEWKTITESLSMEISTVNLETMKKIVDLKESYDVLLKDEITQKTLEKSVLDTLQFMLKSYPDFLSQVHDGLFTEKTYASVAARVAESEKGTLTKIAVHAISKYRHVTDKYEELGNKYEELGNKFLAKQPTSKVVTTKKAVSADVDCDLIKRALDDGQRSFFNPHFITLPNKVQIDMQKDTLDRENLEEALGLVKVCENILQNHKDDLPKHLNPQFSTVKLRHSNGKYDLFKISDLHETFTEVSEHLPSADLHGKRVMLPYVKERGVNGEPDTLGFKSFVPDEYQIRTDLQYYAFCKYIQYLLILIQVSKDTYSEDEEYNQE